jgi:hypothetical protein
VSILYSLVLDVPLRGEGSAECFPSEDFGGAHLAAAARIFVAADLVLGFGDDLRDFNGAARGVDGNKGEVCGGDVAKFLFANVLDHGLYADFHGGAEGAVDAGFEDEQVADLDGGYEVEVVHGGGDGERAGVATGCHGADEIHELHQAAAEEGAEGIGVGG